MNWKSNSSKRLSNKSINVERISKTRDKSHPQSRSFTPFSQKYVR